MPLTPLRTKRKLRARHPNRINVKGTVFLFVLLGMGVFLPLAAYDVEPAIANESAKVESNDLDIEVRIEPLPGGSLESEVTFIGKADDVIVIRIGGEDNSLTFRDIKPYLYNAAGEEIRTSLRYPYQMTFANVNGHYEAFILPKTGEYRIAFRALVNPAGSGEPVIIDDNYLAKVRSASDYERLVMFAKRWSNSEQDEKALELLAQAVEESPEIPEAYLSRFRIYINRLYESSKLEARLETMEADEGTTMAQFRDNYLMIVHDVFLELEEVEQSVVVSDLRQLDKLYSEAIASGQLEPEDEFGEIDGFDPITYKEMADFFETGVPNDIVRRKLIFL